MNQQVGIKSVIRALSPITKGILCIGFILMFSIFCKMWLVAFNLNLFIILLCFYLKEDAIGLIVSLKRMHYLNRKVFPNYCAACGKTREEVLGNPTDIGWLGCRRFVTQGDRYYLERILSYIDEDVISMNCLGFELHINGMQNHMVR